MAKSFAQRNQSPTAIRKIKRLAQASNLDEALVTRLANFVWDFDPHPHFLKEPIGWVENHERSCLALEQLQLAADSFGLTVDLQLSRSELETQILRACEQLSEQELWLNFIEAATHKNYGKLSEFSSFQYLRGTTSAKISLLEWEKDTAGIEDIVHSLFLKLFRGGAIERSNLLYLWSDLTLKLPYTQSESSVSADWLYELLDRIESLPGHSGLKDLIACCKGLVGGNKDFKREVLQALTYADVIRVNELSVTDLCIPEYRNYLSPHFYSNEWSFPLRFWSVNGGNVNRSAVPKLDSI